MRGRLEPKDTVERFWGLKFIGFPNLSDETPKPPGSGRRRSWSRLCGSLWFVCAGVERASREGSSYIYTSSTLTSR